MREEDYGLADDSMIETVEDWNDSDIERVKRMEGYMEDEPYAADDILEEFIEEQIVHRDASVELIVENDRMSAAIFVHEPEGNGRDITKEDLENALAEKGIVYGIFTDKIDDIAENKTYRQLYKIAEGKPPVDGQNGKIKDYFPRKHQLKFAQKENGGIDFKNMNLIHNVKKGDLVCEITQPKEGEDGIDIYGQPVRAKRGRIPPIPQGKNIVYSEDQTQLLTGCEGNLTFRNGRFHVENVFEVAGNVDNSVGNIQFSGSVYIRGDVYEGYEVRAKGDITVVGMVEGAHLEAGGDILLHKGMRGMKTGVLKAKGNITGQFLEDCTIYAKGNVDAEYIINSKVSCEKNVTLFGRRGAFIGGSCAVYHTMKVKTVGAMSHIATDITLGVTPELLEAVETAKAEVQVVTKQLLECRKNIDYLAAKEKAGMISESQQNRLNELKIQEPVNQMRMKQLQAALSAMNQQIREVGKSRLVADTVHAGTVIHIGDAVMQIKRQEDQCVFYYMDGEIKKGMH